MPYPANPPVRGEIYWVDFDPARGSEQAGRRPAVIVSGNAQNKILPTVLIAALTTTVKPGRTRVHLPAGSPLRHAGDIMTHQIMTISKANRLLGYMGQLNRAQLDELKRAMLIALQLT